MLSNTVYHCDSLLSLVPEFDVLITDPPYADKVHSNATSQSAGRGTRHRDLGFDCITPEIQAYLWDLVGKSRRWSLIYSDVEGAGYFYEHSYYLRTVPWVRWSMPQLSGDRPPQGFEKVLVFHNSLKKRWNGPGSLTHLAHTCLRGESKHKAEKPLDQALDLVSWFSEPGELVFDPFAGHGTIGLACKLLGRSYVGYEKDQAWADRAASRLSEPLTQRDLDRVAAWLETDSEPTTAQGSGPSVDRAQARARDKARVTAWL